MKEINKNIKNILRDSKNIAIVGISDNPVKPSNQVAQYLKSAGYNIYPVNPKYDSVLGEKCYGELKDIPDEIDIVDIFRRPEHVLPVVEEAISIQAKVVWMQLGIQNQQAAQLALQAGLQVVMDRCMKIEQSHLG